MLTWAAVCLILDISFTTSRAPAPLPVALCTGFHSTLFLLLGCKLFPGQCCNAGEPTLRNNFGNDALYLASDPAIRDIVDRMLAQPRCTATGVGTFALRYDASARDLIRAFGVALVV